MNSTMNTPPTSSTTSDQVDKRGPLPGRNGASSNCDTQGLSHASGASSSSSCSSPIHGETNATSYTTSTNCMKPPTRQEMNLCTSSDRFKSGEEDGNSTDALADAFSSSLAVIAAAGQHARRLAVASHNNNRENDSSSWGAAFVTNSSAGTTQSSSGDDVRDCSGDGRSKRTCLLDGEDVAATTASIAKAASQEARLQRQDGDDRPHYHRHRRHSMKSMGEAMDSSAIAATTAYAEHTTVVAHLPPPNSADPATAHSSSGSDRDTDRAVVDVAASSSLLQPFREPCFHTIRQTFDAFVKRASRKSSTRDSSLDLEEQAPIPVHKRTKRGTKRQASAAVNAALAPPKKRSGTKNSRCLDGSDSMEDDSGGSSGSGTEDGYAGSNSSNETVAQSGSCSSPYSEDFSEDSGSERKLVKGQSSGDPLRPMLSKKRESGLSVSSEIADFSSSASYTMNAFKESPSASSSFSMGDDDEDPLDDEDESRLAKQESRKRRAPGWSLVQKQVPVSITKTERDGPQGRPKMKRVRLEERKRAAVSILQTDKPTLGGKPPIMALGCDVMAHVLTFLEPPNILDVLTMPLSKDWLSTFTRQPELWRVLCLLEPFKAQVEDEAYDSCSSDDSSVDSFPFDSESTAKKATFRLLYTAYVRCMRCLARIKDDAINGRPLSVVDYSAVLGGNSGTCNIGANHNLQQFLSRARGFVAPASVPVVKQVANDVRVGVSDNMGLASNPITGKIEPNEQDRADESSKKKKIKFGHSKLTQRLLGPTRSGDVGLVELPWACGIYSIVNWMVAFSDVEGIQTMCLRVLPFLLENEQQRMTAQRTGLTDIVLRGMVLFPESAMLHTAAFHTIVLLARPLGGQEGMLFHTSMVNSSGIFSSTAEGAAGGKSGIAVLLDSMRRFQSDEVLQSMSCWSLVNIALAPAQKEVLVKLGGIEVIAQAMMEHPYNAEVQFRALFALINLVIPSVSGADVPPNPDLALLDGDSSEKEMLDEMVDQIVNLVVLSMKNFCSNEAILNRACLVLHNLSLTPSYHSAMLWTPNCYQMLEWCLGNYRTDQVLQQSAAGTLHRLQMTLGSDATLRSRFAASIQAQQKQSLEEAHQEAVRLHEQQELRAAQQLLQGTFGM